MNVLIYGDSNTYGETAFAESRLSPDERWASLLARSLSKGSTVVAEGFSGRTAGDLQADWEGLANGQQYFYPIYGSHTPVDVLIIALGTNDFKQPLNRTAEQILDDLKWYLSGTRTYYEKNGHGQPPRVLYLVPADFDPNDYYPGNTELQPQLRQLLQDSGLDIIDVPEPIDLTNDGVHFSVRGHQQIAQIVYESLKQKEQV